MPVIEIVRRAISAQAQAGQDLPLSGRRNLKYSVNMSGTEAGGFITTTGATQISAGVFGSKEFKPFEPNIDVTNMLLEEGAMLDVFVEGDHFSYIGGTHAKLEEIMDALASL